MSAESTKLSGRFITLEGIEGVGKSTHLTYIESYLTQREIAVITTREPGGTAIAESLRKVLLNQQEESLTQQAELLLLFASRAQNIAHLIQPALAANKWVLCDRFTDASYAYQGYGRGIPLAEIAGLEQWVQGNLRPDLVLVFDAPVHVALRRAKGRGKPDRIEAENKAFFERVRKGYLERAAQFPERYKVIDASVPLSKVRIQLEQVLVEFLACCQEHVD